jgi:hypothetical protein
MLNYSIDCYFEITETGGFFIKQVRDKDGGTDSLTSSTGDFLYSTDGNPIQIRTSTTNIDLPQINPQISVNFS